MAANWQALLHVPATDWDSCELTYLERTSIDALLAARQHAQYSAALRAAGIATRVLQTTEAEADAVFIEDVAVVLDEAAILLPMGVASRKQEPLRTEAALAQYRDVHRLPPSLAIEGGDVLQIDRTLLVGLSPRTTAESAAALAEVVARWCYSVRTVRVTGCLHLKTACTALDDQTLLVQPAWIETADLDPYAQMAVPAEEPWAANVVRLPNALLCASEHPRTIALLRSRGHAVVETPLSEFAKAEGGPTCLSLLFRRESVLAE